MYDAIVIGARCAGATTAMLLARQGHRVLLMDRARFPSDIPQGHFIHQQGPSRLARWGLLERIEASGCPAVDTVVADMGDFPLRSSGVAANGVGFGYGPRRTVLDKILLDAAESAGAEIRECCSFEEPLREGGQVVGVRGRSAWGNTFTERAAVVIGADGKHSRLARMVAAPMYAEVPTLACYAYSYWSGIDQMHLSVHVRANRAIFAFPTNDNLFAVFTAAPIAEAARMKADVEFHVDQTLNLVPSLAEVLRAGRREERFYGSADLPNFFRKPYGPGWALVGDAGCHKDPYMALGVSEALRDAELLSDALHAALTGERSFDAALADYETRRNEACMPMYQENIRQAQLLPLPAEILQLRAALRAQPEDARAFFKAYFGVTPRESFFNESNLQRVMQASGMA
jgi:flavin-dependent dehydrogenase